MSPHQVRQAETQRDAAAETVTARLPETTNGLLTPVLLAASFAGTRLRMEPDRVPSDPP